MNEYDSSRMADLLGDSHAMEITHNEAEADVLLLNTCSIREKTQDKVYHQLGRWRKLKEANPHVKIGAQSLGNPDGYPHVIHLLSFKSLSFAKLLDVNLG